MEWPSEDSGEASANWQDLIGLGRSCPGDCMCSESTSNIWYCFSCSQDSQIQESRGRNGRGTTHYWKSSDPLAKFLLLVPMTLCSTGLEVLVPKGKMLPSGDKPMISLNWKLRLSPSHFGLFMPLNKKAKKEVIVLAEVINPDSKGKLDCYSTMRIKKSMSGIQEIS